MLNRTKGLTEEEKKTAREKILERAKKLGVDTGGWQKMEATRHLSAFHFSAMALQMPEVSGHPNRAPFSGILLPLDKASDYAPKGTDGHKILVPKDVASKGLSSLLGMAVDFMPNFDGHDPKNKIGIITEAKIEDGAIAISGFFYEKNFPSEVAFIREQKSLLGFSMEADYTVYDTKKAVWTVEEITFTGAAVLYKADAAYTTTSLAAANSQKEKTDMEELKKLLARLTERIDKIEKAGLEANASMQANKELIDLVHPHAEACRACAEGMRASGLGLHATRGHVAVMHRIAHHMESEAASGLVPSEIPSRIFHDTNWMNASRETDPGVGSELKKLIEGIKTEMGALGTKMADLQAKAFTDSASPQRKTLTPEIAALLNKAGLLAAAEKGELDIETVDRTLEAAGIKGRAAIEAKLRLMEGGLLAQGKAA
jgi:hypothetical protein